MPGLFRSAATVMFLLLGQADVSTTVALPISLGRVFLLLVWVYLCLHLVQRVEVSPLVPNQYKSLLHVVTLFAGPLVFLGLVLVDSGKSGDSGEPLGGFLPAHPRAVRSIWQSRKHPVGEESALHLFDASGKELSQLYGHGEKPLGRYELPGLDRANHRSGLAAAGQRPVDRSERPVVVRGAAAHRWHAPHGTRTFRRNVPGGH